ncbi:hypothetical protein JHD46_08310, partial [Sulfurimonas sp. SAG-AH-194-C20]
PYMNTSLLKIDAISHDDLELGTLIGASYSRDDISEYEKYIASEKIKIGGCVDIVFTSRIIKETISLPVVGGKASLPSEYYIDAVPLGLNMSWTIISSDEMFNGIINTPLEIFIQDSIDTVDIKVTKYTNPSMGILENKEIEISDILIKGSYPLFLDLTLVSTDDNEGRRIDIFNAIESYFNFNGRVISMISPSEIHSVLRNIGVEAVVSSENSGKIYLNAGISKDLNIGFPITMKDIPLFGFRDKDRVSRNTISIHLGTLNIIKE